MARRKKSSNGGRRPGAGRPKGSRSPRQGSGKHPIDATWAMRGYLTITEAGRVAGVTRTTIVNRINDGTIPASDCVVDSVTYVRRTAAEKLRHDMRAREQASAV